MLLFDLDFTDVGLVAVQAMHRQPQNKHQDAQSNPDLGIFGSFNSLLQDGILKLHFHIFGLKTAMVIIFLLISMMSMSRSDNIRQKGTVAPSTYFLTFQDGIFLMKHLQLFFHILEMSSLSISIMLGVAFVPFPRLSATLGIILDIRVQLFLQLEVKQVVLGDF